MLLKRKFAEFQKFENTPFSDLDIICGDSTFKVFKRMIFPNVLDHSGSLVLQHLRDALFEVFNNLSQVHRVMVWGASEWFEKALSGNFREAEEQFTYVGVRIQDEDPKYIEILLDWIYKGHFPTVSNDGANLSILFHCYRIGDYFVSSTLCEKAVQKLRRIMNQIYRKRTSHKSLEEVVTKYDSLLHNFVALIQLSVECYSAQLDNSFIRALMELCDQYILLLRDFKPFRKLLSEETIGQFGCKLMLHVLDESLHTFKSANCIRVSKFPSSLQVLQATQPNDMAPKHKFSYKFSELESFENPPFSDLDIICGDRTFKAHRVMVWGASKWFSKALKSGFKEAKEKCIKIHDEDPKYVELLLNHIYKDDFPTVMRNGSNLSILFHCYRIGDYFQTQSLCDRALEELKRIMDEVQPDRELEPRKEVMQRYEALLKEFTIVVESSATMFSAHRNSPLIKLLLDICNNYILLLRDFEPFRELLLKESLGQFNGMLILQLLADTKPILGGCRFINSDGRKVTRPRHAGGFGVMVGEVCPDCCANGDETSLYPNGKVQE
ncbi:hypothetical protein BT63DRAFT_481178 [Microthyrium microscopicum]|uniref:BTB domain-containing protein n=1 Tax=Microthyrium microscopicum TaxID=703497 RepID=A0A6A6U461_9PEZI|nr:hypothetical protein BT63DRAFT_481178 [Microthyrium microscopicum]